MGGWGGGGGGVNFALMMNFDIILLAIWAN